VGLLLTFGSFSSADSDPLMFEFIADDAPQPMVFKRYTKLTAHMKMHSFLILMCVVPLAASLSATEPYSCFGGKLLFRI
jgi:hypothetical protein